MASENDILIAMQEAVRKALCEAANEEIEKLMHKFECRMGEIKRDMVGKIINQIDITTNHDPACEGYTVQVHINRQRYMNNNKVRFRIDTHKNSNDYDMWSFCIGLSHFVDETYLYINFFKWTISIGFLYEDF